MKKQKVNVQVNGKNEERKSYKTLDQLFGDSGANKFGTLELDSYQNKLAAMNIVDLQEECTKYGLMPGYDRHRMIERLLGEFKAHLFSYSKNDKVVNNAKPASKAALAVLSQGK